MPTFTADLLLFDLDGTLVDSSASVHQMWRAWCEKEGVDADELLAVSEGRQGRDVVAEFAPHLDPVAEDEWIIAYQLDHVGDVTPVAGAGPMLARLETDDWAIVTSCVRDLANARLHAAGLPQPPLMVPADELAEGKPSPEGFLTAADRLGVDPARCLVFEDSVAGVEAAHAGGMTAVAITAVTKQTPQADAAAADWNAIRLDRQTGNWAIAVDG